MEGEEGDDEECGQGRGTVVVVKHKGEKHETIKCGRFLIFFPHLRLKSRLSQKFSVSL